MTDDAQGRAEELWKELASVQDSLLRNNASIGLITQALCTERRLALISQVSSLPCTWTPDEDGIYWTSCDHGFVLGHDGPLAECAFRFCCYCGKPLVERPYVDPRGDEQQAGGPS